METAAVDNGGLDWSINNKNGEKWMNYVGRMDGWLELMDSRMTPGFDFNSQGGDVSVITGKDEPEEGVSGGNQEFCSG